MGYNITEGTVKWARTRVDELEKGLIYVGSAIENLEKVPEDLRNGAWLMDNQPDSDMIRSYAMDVEKLEEDLKKRLSEMKKDLRDIRRGIRKHEEVQHEHSA